MKTRRILQPGQPGTKKWVEKYGKELLCVRYRLDPESKKTLKTIELIVEERPWQPAAGRIPMNKKMQIRVRYGEVNLGKQVRAVGGKWNRQKQVWELPYQNVLKLGLTDRITE